MKQFDVCENLSSAGRRRFPFVLVLQSGFLDELETRVVAPLAREGAFVGATRLNPVFEINNKVYCLSTPELAGVPVKSIGKMIVSLASERDRIIRALDILFVGF